MLLIPAVLFIPVRFLPGYGAGLSCLFIIDFVRLRLPPRAVTLTNEWWVAVAFTLVGALVWGLANNPVATTVGTYQFATSADVQDGRYVQLATDGTTVYLQSCAPSHSIVSVNASEVLTQTSASVAPSRRSSPNLFGVLFQGDGSISLGYALPC